MRLVRSASVHVNGVSVKHEICAAMDVIDQLHLLVTGRDAEFTSIVDGTHRERSRHYSGLAVDLRQWYLDDIPAFVKELKRQLGPRYQVIPEQSHIHIEYDPESLA